MMPMFGKSNGGGRRTAQRETAPALVTYFTLSRSATVLLIDVSSTGARLRGDLLPEPGEELILAMEGVRTYGVVAWTFGGECGIGFDRRLPPGSLQRLRHSVAMAGGMTPELKAAFDEWTGGVAPCIPGLPSVAP